MQIKEFCGELQIIRSEDILHTEGIGGLKIDDEKQVEDGGVFERKLGIAVIVD